MPGTTNFLQFNPTQANQETDAEYMADSTRSGGAGVDAIWPSASANKTLYQVATMTAALGQMLANKGFSVSDSSYAALVSQLANILTTADQQGGLQNLVWSSSIVLNAAAFNAFAVPLQGPTNLSLTGVVAGRVYVVFYTQNGTGSWGVTFGSGFGPTSCQPDTTANVTSVQVFTADATLTLQPAGPIMSSGGINSTPIGNSNPSAGAFTTLRSATPNSSDNSTNVATTAWCVLGFAVSIGTSGYIKFPAWMGSIMFQWWSASLLANTGSAPYIAAIPISFSTNCLWASVTPSATSINGLSKIIGISPADKSHVMLANANNQNVQSFLLAIGY